MWEEVCWAPEPLLPAQRMAVQVGILAVVSSSSVILWVLRRFSVGVCGFRFDVFVEAVVFGEVVEDVRLVFVAGEYMRLLCFQQQNSPIECPSSRASIPASFLRQSKCFVSFNVVNR